MIVKICASPLSRQWRESSSHPLLHPSSLCLSVMHPHPHPHAKSPRRRCITDGQVTDSSLIRSTSSSDGFLLMGRWYGTVVRDVEDCIREAAARGRGRDFSDIVFTSELPCNPIRTHSCLTIQQQFIRSSAHSSHGGNTRMCAINAPCVARNKCTLKDSAAGATHPQIYSTQHRLQYMPYSTFLPGLGRAVFSPNSHLL